MLAVECALLPSTHPRACPNQQQRIGSHLHILSQRRLRESAVTVRLVRTTVRSSGKEELWTLKYSRSETLTKESFGMVLVVLAF